MNIIVKSFENFSVYKNASVEAVICGRTDSSSICALSWCMLRGDCTLKVDL
jgi:hypothetical protein